MSILINNDLIWVAIPRCASHSIESALMNSRFLDCKHFANYKNIDESIYFNGSRYHFHCNLDYLYNIFGVKESICIKREFLDRWLNSLEYLYRIYKYFNIKTFVEWKDIDNSYIYEVFDNNFVGNLYNDNYMSCASKILDENIEKIQNFNFLDTIGVLSSDKKIKNGETCTYEFDIKEIYKFEEFIRNRYNIDFKLDSININEKIKSKIVVNDELKKWIFDKFEKPFIKNKII